MNPMFSFIESIQSSKTGFFGNDLLKYNTLSGAYKVMLIYAKHNRALPNAEKIYNSIWDVIDNNNATAAAYVSNSCELLNTMAVSFGCGNRIKEKLKAAYGVLQHRGRGARLIWRRKCRLRYFRGRH